MKEKLIYLTCFTALLAGICTAQPTNTTATLVPVGINSFRFVEKHDLNCGTARGYVTLSRDDHLL